MTLAAGRVLFGIIFLGVAILVWAGIGRAMRKGELPSRLTRPTRRWEQPFAFWLGIAVYAVTASWLSLVGAAFCGFAPHWFLNFIIKKYH